MQDQLFQSEAPSIRLASGANDVREENRIAALNDRQPVQRGPNGPVVRLAHIDGAQGDCTLKGEKGVPQIVDAPALLVSYYYLEPFLKEQHRYRYRDWVMDSGAFSAHNSGATIQLSEYIDKCLELMGSDPTLTEVFALDVIGDAEASLKNTEEMWRQGVPAIPCFHAEEPEEFLLHMAKAYPKIALGGVALARGDAKLDWLTQCFARVWPKKVHGFGVSGEDAVYSLPFHSVDATNWEIAPCAFGNWQKFGAMSVRGSNQDLRSQVRHYLDMEAKARVRWEREMRLLEELEPSKPIYTGMAPAGRSQAPTTAPAAPIGGRGATRLTKDALAGRAPSQPAKAAPDIRERELDDKWKRNWWE